MEGTATDNVVSVDADLLLLSSLRDTRPCETAAALRQNFLLFSVLYSVVHASVDVVLAFSAAELGPDLGSWGGFTLYATYTLSALCLAKPLLRLVVGDAKDAVVLGLLGMLLYVAGFYAALLLPKGSQWQWVCFLAGAGLGGLSAGVLWTAQGAYFTLNARLLASTSSSSSSTPSLASGTASEMVVTFAGLFAGLYLGIETATKFVATAIFLLASASASSSFSAHWKPVVFGLYTFCAAVATGVFVVYIKRLQEETTDSQQQQHSQHSSAGRKRRRFSFLQPRRTHSTTIASAVVNDSDNQTTPCLFGLIRCKSESLSVHDVFYEALTVLHELATVPKLQLLIPYQVCFGLSAGLVETYVNGVVVGPLLGDGYIGLLSGTVTLTAALLAMPTAMFANRWVAHGRSALMVLGAVAFSMGGCMLLVWSDESLAVWPVIIWFYIFHGIARCIWENTNKAIIADYFGSDEDRRDAAFASVYFASGLSGAFGFVFFQFLSRWTIAVLNVATAGIALTCFLFAQRLHNQEVANVVLLSDLHKLTDSNVGYDHLPDVDSDNEEEAPFVIHD
jgi:MFS family permease